MKKLFGLLLLATGLMTGMCLTCTSSTKVPVLRMAATICSMLTS